MHRDGAGIIRNLPRLHVAVGIRPIKGAGFGLSMTNGTRMHAAVFVHRADGKIWIAQYPGDSDTAQGTQKM